MGAVHVGEIWLHASVLRVDHFDFLGNAFGREFPFGKEEIQRNV
jgi:hypothetical protein